MKKLIVILFFLPFLRAFSQEQILEPSRFITRFGFSQFTGGVIVFRGQVEPFSDTLNFILDTGSGGISLDSATVQHFGLIPQPSNQIIRGIGGIRKVSFVHNRKLKIPGLTIDSLNFHINDYSILSAVYGHRIDGIVGYSVLSRYIIRVNYDSNYLEFWTKGDLDYPRDGYLLRPAIHSLPIQDLKVRDGRTLYSRFLFDMGAGLNMIFSWDFVKDSSLLHRKRQLYSKQVEGMGGPVDMTLTVVREVKLGPYKFKKVPVYVFEDVYNITSYPSLGGILGSDLLRRFNVILNYPRKEIHLMPNSHYFDPFDYSYSGIELYKINGLIVVGDVAEGSPAEKAGVLVDDVVIAVNNNFSQDLQQYKASIQSTGSRLKLIVQRNGELKSFDFRVKNILRRSIH